MTALLKDYSKATISGDLDDINYLEESPGLSHVVFQEVYLHHLKRPVFRIFEL